MDANKFVTDGNNITDLSSGNIQLLFHYATENFYTKKRVVISDLPYQTNRMNLRFPSIIQLYYVENIDNELEFYQEFFPNGDLKNFTKNNCIVTEDIARFFYQCARGLQYLHKNGYIHRDISPRNIFIDINRNASLGDLEYSTNNPDASSRIISKYSAPEIKEVPNTKKSDIYSIGATFGKYILKYLEDDDLKNEFLNIVSQTKAEEPDNRISADELVGQIEDLLKKNGMQSIIDEFECRIEPCQNNYTFCRLDDIKGIRDNQFIQEIVSKALD
ncbi:TKL family protein kinase [Trichomonas vaginalis G3]|uniref:TKL family protein kinase n=1 Tax=Trichomonas vaginalis (strain ATCC PRA-98 / G3) TaxID=412133 RepID=A2E180_TRIV3|nr:protein serine/threonine kinase protein [Trichomonas vaginalis G3]EAY13581.1 TKL family protein kinase [Trichomonas vaginalis G3]KAI5486411.1 protein serine/threonine kinase protein [Trichomonas vaginalis G3]|eukprot:XP_001325804.1 TKL family protein kinase [Trichomonas vaginalis G3]